MNLQSSYGSIPVGAERARLLQISNAIVRSQSDNSTYMSPISSRHGSVTQSRHGSTTSVFSSFGNLTDLQHNLQGIEATCCELQKERAEMTLVEKVAAIITASAFVFQFVIIHLCAKSEGGFDFYVSNNFLCTSLVGNLSSQNNNRQKLVF